MTGYNVSNTFYSSKTHQKKGCLVYFNVKGGNTYHERKTWTGMSVRYIRKRFRYGLPGRLEMYNRKPKYTKLTTTLKKETNRY